MPPFASMTVPGLNRAPTAKLVKEKDAGELTSEIRSVRRVIGR
jgi:hypothetical protein